jgi:hypothetical protein
MDNKCSPSRDLATESSIYSFELFRLHKIVKRLKNQHRRWAKSRRTSRRCPKRHSTVCTPILGRARPSSGAHARPTRSTTKSSSWGGGKIRLVQLLLTWHTVGGDGVCTGHCLHLPSSGCCGWPLPQRASHGRACSGTGRPHGASRRAKRPCGGCSPCASSASGRRMSAMRWRPSMTRWR